MLQHKVKYSFNISINIQRGLKSERGLYINCMNCRSVCDLTHCFVARLGSRWALTLAPHCVQLIWTRTACRTCWWGLPCTASSGMRARCLYISAKATWVGSVGQWEHSTITCRLFYHSLSSLWTPHMYISVPLLLPTVSILKSACVWFLCDRVCFPDSRIKQWSTVRFNNKII